MPKSSRLLVAAVFLLAIVALAARPAPTAVADSGTIPPLTFAAASLETERQQGQKLADKVVQYIGPLAPVALSPFFALTCLSGASLLGNADVPLLDGLQKNVVLGANSPLNNPVVFAGLLGLTILTSLPKFTKVTKPLGQAIDQIEAHAGIIAVIAVQFLSSVRFGDEPAATATAVTVVHAGIFSFTADLLIYAFTAINIFVVNTVKFFFEVLTWLSPIPAVDAAFEAANKTVAAFLVGLYVAWPWLALILNLLIFAVCLLIFAWAYRRVVYMRCVLGDPILGWLAENVFRRPPATPTSTHLPGAIAQQLPDRKLVVRAFAGRAVPEVKRKARGFLVRSGDRLVFAQPRFLRSPLIVDLPPPGPQNAIQTGLLSNTVRLGDAGTELILTRRYNRVLDEIRAQLGQAAISESAQAVPTSERVIAASRDVGAAARVGAGREALRAELA